MQNQLHAASPQLGLIATTMAPAKLNLFLELLSKREDGFHDIDTIMVPIDWCDQLRVQLIKDPEIQLKTNWSPSRKSLAARLGIPQHHPLLDIPMGESNLVWKAIDVFRNEFNIEFGVQCELLKRIPAGAGMGGASSDAASTLACLAKLCKLPLADIRLLKIAEQIGSDVPFFLGCPNEGDASILAARATGRGEILQSIPAPPMHFVVIYPNQSLSTAKVYGESRVPEVPRSSSPLIDAFKQGSLAEISGHMFNRLGKPAGKILPRVHEITESVWRSGLQACQLTGSGSACFAIVSSASEARRSGRRLRGMLEPGALVTFTKSARVPARIDLQQQS